MSSRVPFPVVFHLVSPDPTPPSGRLEASSRGADFRIGVRSRSAAERLPPHGRTKPDCVSSLSGLAGSRVDFRSWMLTEQTRNPQDIGVSISGASDQMLVGFLLWG